MSIAIEKNTSGNRAIGMYGHIELVTPEMAENLLDTNPRNRTIKKAKVTRLVEDMLTGQFEVTHQGIAISVEGKLLDGHHRLTAIVRTGVPQWLFVVRNAPESTKIDVGTARTDRDSLYMGGVVERDSNEWNCLTMPLVTTIMTRAFNQSYAKYASAIIKHWIYMSISEHIDAIVNMATSGRLRGSLILYTMLCAEMNGVDTETLNKWLKIVSTGDFYMEGDDVATRAGRGVLLFKNYVENKNTTAVAGTDAKSEMIKKGMSSISWFAKRRAPQKIYGEYVYSEETVFSTIEKRINGLIEEGVIPSGTAKELRGAFEMKRQA